MFSENYHLITAQVREHCNELQRQAERERLAQGARRYRSARKPFYGALLAGLGARLMNWGWRLQTHYGTVAQRHRIKVKLAAYKTGRPAVVMPNKGPPKGRC